MNVKLLFLKALIDQCIIWHIVIKATLNYFHCSIFWLKTGILKSLFPNNWSGDKSVTRNREN